MQSIASQQLTDVDTGTIKGTDAGCKLTDPLRSIEDGPRRLTDMLLRYNEVMLRGCRASIFKHDIVTILKIGGMSIAILRTRRVDVEGRVHFRRILGNVPRRQH